MSVHMRATDDGIDFVNTKGDVVFSISDDGKILGAPVPAAPAPVVAPGAPAPVLPEPVAVSIVTPKDLPTAIAAIKVIINVLKQYGVTE